MREPLGHLLRRKAVDVGALPIGGAGRARVLMYHGIGDPGCEAINVRHISSELFERHLRLYREYFHVVPMERLLAGERDRRKLTVALTFDDGFRNNFTHALPLLEQYELPASFFITGANPAGLRCLWGDLLDLAEQVTSRPLVIAGERFIRNAAKRYVSERDGTLLNHRIKQHGVFAPKQALYDQLDDLLDGPLKARSMFWELMNDVELREVARHPLITLGSHGWFHTEMGRIPPGEVTDELERSRAHLRGLTGREVDMIAWPSGSYSTEAVHTASAMGFSHQFAVGLIDKSDRERFPMLLSRYGVYDFPVSDRWFMHLIARGAHA